MRLIVSLLILVITSSSFAQGGPLYGRKNLPLVDFGGRYKMSGWLIEPGATWDLTRFGNPEEQYNDQTIKVNPGGKLGAYLGIGRYNFFYEGGRFINYLDYSVAYKMLRGKEEITGAIEAEGKYSHNFLLGNFNLNNVIQLSDRTFITRQSHSAHNADVNPSKVVANLHYKFGVGFKINSRLFVIPTLETPILNVHNFEKFKSTWGIFNSRYRPLILTVRLAWLRPVGKADCPPVHTNDGDKKAQENFQMR